MLCRSLYFFQQVNSVAATESTNNSRAYIINFISFIRFFILSALLLSLCLILNCAAQFSQRKNTHKWCMYSRTVRSQLIVLHKLLNRIGQKTSVIATIAKHAISHPYAVARLSVFIKNDLVVRNVIHFFAMHCTAFIHRFLFLPVIVSVC